MKNQISFTITCNKCGYPLLIDKDLMGKRTPCPSCQNEMVIPPCNDFTPNDNNVQGNIQEQAKWKNNLRLIAAGIQFIIFVLTSIKSGGGFLSVINFFIVISLLFSKGSIFRCLFFVGSWIYIASFIRLANQGGQITVCLFAGFIESILIAISIRNADMWNDNYKIIPSPNNDIQKDLAKTVELWRKAAEQGDIEAQYNLGVCYYNGIGVMKDLSKAVELWRKAAEQGDTEAQYNLGVCYYNGIGVIKDLSKAVDLWRKAAEQGDDDAKERLQKLNIN